MCVYHTRLALRVATIQAFSDPKYVLKFVKQRSSLIMTSGVQKYLIKDGQKMRHHNRTIAAC